MANEQMKTVTVDMFHNYECKGSHRYDNVNQSNDPLNAIYLSKKSMGGVVPKRIQITIRDMTPEGE
jgi:hypothetical protein